MEKVQFGWRIKGQVSNHCTCHSTLVLLTHSLHPGSKYEIAITFQWLCFPAPSSALHTDRVMYLMLRVAPEPTLLCPTYSTASKLSIQVQNEAKPQCQRPNHSQRAFHFSWSPNGTVKGQHFCLGYATSRFGNPDAGVWMCTTPP